MVFYLYKVASIPKGCGLEHGDHISFNYSANGSLPIKLSSYVTAVIGSIVKVNGMLPGFMYKLFLVLYLMSGSSVTPKS